METFLLIVLLVLIILSPYMFFYWVPRSIFYLYCYISKRHFIRQRDKFVSLILIWGSFLMLIAWDTNFELVNYSRIEAVFSIIIPAMIAIAAIMVLSHRSKRTKFDLYYINKSNAESLLESFHDDFEETPEVIFKKNYTLPTSLAFSSISNKRAVEIMKEIGKDKEAFQEFGSSSAKIKIRRKIIELVIGIGSFTAFIIVMNMVAGR